MINTQKIWWEKYRPQTLDDIILPEYFRKKCEEWKQSKQIPHLLLCGSPGTGKTSIAKIIVKDILKCDYLYINASDKNGIDTIRTEIIGFSQTMSYNGGIKVVILDESDSLSGEAQRALRNTMEEYAELTRFILTANYKHKIITPIQSRCESYEFNHSVKELLARCLYILKSEGIKTEKQQLQNLVELVRNNYPDFRKTISNIQKFSNNGELQIVSNTVCSTFVHTLYERLKVDDIISLRKYVIENESVFSNDYHSLLKNLLEELYKASDIDILKKRECILNIAEHMYRSSFCQDHEINAYCCIINLSKILKT